MYRLRFRGYRKEELRVEEVHLFSNLRDAHAHAASLLKFTSYSDWCDRYDVRIDLPDIDGMMPLVA
jgi:hypothetical protein|nr:MAG TPA: endodeoxyribonuclease I [Caudoviricetes sp.]